MDLLAQVGLFTYFSHVCYTRPILLFDWKSLGCCLLASPCLPLWQTVTVLYLLCPLCSGCAGRWGRCRF